MTGSPGRGADAVPRKLALITGASSGIGRAFALRLAAEGYDLILVARDSRRLETLAAELHAAHGINAEVLAADLTDPPQLLAVERCITRADTLDLLINNAGFITVGSFADNDPDGQEAMIRLHVIATVRLTRAALPGMIANELA